MLRPPLTTTSPTSHSSARSIRASAGGAARSSSDLLDARRPGGRGRVVEHQLGSPRVAPTCATISSALPALASSVATALVPPLGRCRRAEEDALVRQWADLRGPHATAHRGLPTSRAAVPDRVGHSAGVAVWLERYVRGEGGVAMTRVAAARSASDPTKTGRSSLRARRSSSGRLPHRVHLRRGARVRLGGSLAACSVARSKSPAGCESVSCRTCAGPGMGAPSVVVLRSST